MSAHLSTEPARIAPAALRLPDDVAWTGDLDVIHELLGGHCDLAAALDESPSAQVVKSGQHRDVYRVSLSSGRYYVKHFKVRDLRGALRAAFRGAAAEREARAIAAVRAAGVDTVETVAWGVGRGSGARGDSFLITRELEEVEPLDEFLRRQGGSIAPGVRRSLAEGLGALAGRLHRSGITHEDLHPGNILVRKTVDGEPLLCAIDLQRIRRHRRVTLRSGRRDLFALDNSFFRDCSRSDRARFFLAYGRESCLIDDTGDAARLVERWCARALRREQASNDRKWQRTHRRLIVADTPAGACRGLALLGEARMLAWRDDPERVFRDERVRFWRRRSPGARSAAIDLLLAEGAIACDAFETTRPRRGFERLRPSDARRTWEMAHALLRRGVATVHPWLYVESRAIASVRELLLIERPPIAVSLPAFLAHHLPSLRPVQRERWMERAGRSLATGLRRLDQFALCHDELRAAELLVSPQGDVYFAAPGRVRRRKLWNRTALGTSLAALQRDLTAFDGLRASHRLRFLRRLLGPRFRGEWKSVWRGMAPREPVVLRTSSVLRRAAAVLLLCGATALAGCTLAERPVTLPVRHQVKSDQLLVLSDVRLSKNHPLIQELNKLRDDVGQILELPLARDPVVVYLFSTEQEYRRYMQATFPKLPPRSAYFLGNSTELAVYTHWGDKIREDLRHEYTHGLLHSVAKYVPLWLDEGLAEYFEIVGPRPGGINHDYARRLTEGLVAGWRPDLKRLETLDEKLPLKRADYQESWAWVHFMLNGGPETKAALVDYMKDLREIKDLREKGTPQPLSERLADALPKFEERFAAYVSHLPTATQMAGGL